MASGFATSQQAARRCLDLNILPTGAGSGAKSSRASTSPTPRRPPGPSGYRALAEAALPPLRQLPRDLWRFEVDVDRVADLSSSERLERVKLNHTIPDHRQWPTYQTVGEMLFADGWSGILYEAAARRGSLALCLFLSGEGNRDVEPIPPPARHEDRPLHRAAYAPELLTRPRSSAP